MPLRDELLWQLPVHVPLRLLESNDAFRRFRANGSASEVLQADRVKREVRAHPFQGHGHLASVLSFGLYQRLGLGQAWLSVAGVERCISGSNILCRLLSRSDTDRTAASPGWLCELSASLVEVGGLGRGPQQMPQSTSRDSPAGYAQKQVFAV